MISSPIDPQISGVRNNGSAHGIVDVNQASGPLVLVPWREAHISTTGSLVKGGAGGGDNGDGSTGYIQFQTPTTVGAGSSANYIRWMFYGTTLGVRFDPYFTTGGGGTYDFGVYIDRVAYRVSKQQYYDESLLPWDIQGNDFHGVIVARDLSDGPHHAEIHVAPNVGVNGQRIFGFLADSKWYRPTPSRAYTGTATPLTTSFVTVTLSSVNRFRGLGLRAILYVNPDTAPRMVTVQDGTGATIWSEIIPIGKSATFNPRALLGINGTAGSIVGELKHKVDAIATTAVQSTVIAGL
jgi:hypothetical protein